MLPQPLCVPPLLIVVDSHPMHLCRSLPADTHQAAQANSFPAPIPHHPPSVFVLQRDGVNTSTGPTRRGRPSTRAHYLAFLHWRNVVLTTFQAIARPSGDVLSECFSLSAVSLHVYLIR